MSRLYAVAALVLLAQLVTGSQVEELSELRARSRDAVIKLDDSSIKRYLLGKSRDFAAAVFFAADQVSSENPTLRLDDLRNEYALAAKAFASGPDADQMFFFEAKLEDVQSMFALFQVASLPTVMRIDPKLALEKPPVEIPKADKMLPDTVDMKQYPWPAEMFLKHLAKDLRTGPVVRPSIYNSPLFPFIAAAAVGALVFLGYKVYMLDLLRHPSIWATISLGVFWFSVSGGMFNIIRGMPLFIRDRNGRLQFFLGSRSSQLGAEGFILGGLYVLCSGSVAYVTYVAPKIRHKALREVTSWVSAVAAIAAIYYTFKFWMAKTGYSHVWYF